MGRHTRSLAHCPLFGGSKTTITYRRPHSMDDAATLIADLCLQWLQSCRNRRPGCDGSPLT